MPLRALNRKELKDLLIKNWMTHDALWYGEVALKFGMNAASPMNLKVCRKLGRIECRRLMEKKKIASPTNIAEYRELFEFAKEVFVPDFMKFQIEYPGNDTQIFHVLDCFAHRGMEKAGRIADYECGIFARIEGWLDAMGLKYDRTPDLSRCLKFKGKTCRITVTLDFKSAAF
jgi:hypothetical protein